MSGSGSQLHPTEPVDPQTLQRLQLLIWEPDGSARQLELEPGTLTIGRAGAEVDIPLADPAVSRQHASLFVDEVVELRDEGSSNGTFVGGNRATPKRHVTLALDEPVVVGATTLIVRRGGVPTTTVPAGGTAFISSAVRSLVNKIAGLHSSVFIVGETGTGKSMLARSLHERRKATGPLVEIHCRGAEPETLRREFEPDGVFARARAGTLVIDELNAMPLALQDRFVAILDAQESAPAADRPRIIVTTRVAPSDAIRLGTLRKELRYRLAAVNVTLSPLRERLDEVPAIAQALLDTMVEEHRVAGRRFAPDAVSWLGKQAWPGNLRELEATVRAALIGGSDRDVTVADLTALQTDAVPEPDGERERIVAALAACGGNQSAAAKMLGISRGTLVNRVRRYGLARPRSR
ncbi:MAG: sigma 54-interacting transcriptional regulator [Myxococcota bacterium]